MDRIGTSDLTKLEYQILIARMDELQKQLQMQQIQFYMLREEQKKILEALKFLGIDDLEDIEGYSKT